jgi:N-acetylmuramoyl-L-alanine amidase
METETFKKLNSLAKNNTPEYLIVHHSGGTDANPLADTSEHTAKGMELWHLGKGWDGLGYHYVIHKNGDVWKGRPEHRNGAHAKGYNTKSIGICLAGNFDATKPTAEQEQSLRLILKELTVKYSISPDKIIPHRSVANKTCYGNNLSEDWARNLITENSHSIADHSDVEVLQQAMIILRKYF